MRRQERDPFVIFEVRHEFGDSNAKTRVRHVGGEFGKRDQDEAALVEFWMWNREAWCVNRLILEQQNIQVDFARRPLLGLGSFLAPMACSMA